MRSDIWNDKTIKRAVAMWREGFSLRAIAADLGKTRSAVSGKLNREGYLRGESVKPTISAIPNPKPRLTRPTAITPPSPLPLPINAARRSFNDVSGPSYDLCDLDRGDCRFPIGDPLERDFCWCSAPRHGELPYCLAHCRVAFIGYRVASTRGPGAIYTLVQIR